MHQEKRKLPRFHITPCQFHAAETGQNFSVQDISQGGLAIRLLNRTDIPAFAVGSKHKGVIKVEGLKLECQFQVKYLRGTLVGGEWITPTDALTQHLISISHPEKWGSHLKKYDLPEENGTEWFHNPVGIDLLFYPPVGGGASSSAVGRFTLYIHHSFIFWDLEEGLRTGRAVEEDDEGYAHGIVRLETRLIEYDAHPDHTLIETAKELIKFASAVPENLRNLVLTQLKGPAV